MGKQTRAGVITTSQSLDYATGAGALDLEASATVYLLSPTADVDGLGGGQISASGWDFGALGLAGSNDYIFDIAFDEPIQLTISLNWFSGTKIDEQTDFGESLSFANLNLELWLLSEGVFTSKVAESNSIYNNSEFLRLDLFTSGYYGLRVVFPEWVYNADESTAQPEEYGLAWHARTVETVPEPGAVLLLVFAGLAWIIWRNMNRRKNVPARQTASGRTVH